MADRSAGGEADDRADDAALQAASSLVETETSRKPRTSLSPWRSGQDRRIVSLTRSYRTSVAIFIVSYIILYCFGGEIMQAETKTVTDIETVAAVKAVHVDRELDAVRSLYEQSLWNLVRSKDDTGSDIRNKDKSVEFLLAKYVVLAGALARAKDVDLYRTANFGLTAYTTGLRQVAGRVEQELAFATSTSAAIGQVMRGLLFFLVACISIAYVLLSLVLGSSRFSTFYEDFYLKHSAIVIAVVFGCLGSVVSLLLRLAEFEAMRGRSKQFLLLTGMSLPVVGGTFAAVIAALFASHVITFSLTGTQTGEIDQNLYLLIGFLSGFSERFSRGLLSTVENRFAAGGPRPGTAQTTQSVTVGRSRTTRRRPRRQTADGETARIGMLGATRLDEANRDGG